jgi:hypothetical protein
MRCAQEKLCASTVLKSFPYLSMNEQGARFRIVKHESRSLRSGDTDSRHNDTLLSKMTHAFIYIYPCTRNKSDHSMHHSKQSIDMAFKNSKKSSTAANSSSSRPLLHQQHLTCHAVRVRDQDFLYLGNGLDLMRHVLEYLQGITTATMAMILTVTLRSLHNTKPDTLHGHQATTCTFSTIRCIF